MENKTGYLDDRLMLLSCLKTVEVDQCYVAVKLQIDITCVKHTFNK